ncbi:hypothetical protein AAIP31_002268 [Flavobacterium psychrophilum]
MNYVDALNYKETVTGHTTMIGKYEHVFLVVPSKKEDFIKYTTDYFTKYKDKTFFDETAKEYSTDEDFTVTNFMMLRD